MEGSYPQKIRICQQALRTVLSRMNDVGWMMPTLEVKTILSTRWVIWIRFLTKGLYKPGFHGVHFSGIYNGYASQHQQLVEFQSCGDKQYASIGRLSSLKRGRS
ncbi:MAG: hypothetical protein Ct9H300mP14_15930 [Gammaproteobacteria bacterium]|nr:MAG: hypothetical protein Ct9H300mP14_15930 [Gammaproteobacteria bacterium]